MLGVQTGSMSVISFMHGTHMSWYIQIPSRASVSAVHLVDRSTEIGTRFTDCSPMLTHGQH